MRLLTNEQLTTINAELETNLAMIDKEVAITIYRLRTFANKSERGRKETLEDAIKVLYNQARSEK